MVNDENIDRILRFCEKQGFVVEDYFDLQSVICDVIRDSVVGEDDEDDVDFGLDEDDSLDDIGFEEQEREVKVDKVDKVDSEGELDLSVPPPSGDYLDEDVPPNVVKPKFDRVKA